MAKVLTAPTRVAFPPLMLAALALGGTLDARPARAGVAVVTLEASADTTVRTDLGSRRNDNYGKDEFMTVGSSRGGGGIPEGGADAIRSLIRFDTSGLTLPARRATLELTVFTYISDLPGPELTIDVHRVLNSPPLTPWVEGNGEEEGDEDPLMVPGSVNVDDAFGVAWAGAGDNPSPDAANNTTQPPFDFDRSARAAVSAGSHPRGTVVRWDVTDLVNGWIAGTPNEGIVLRDPTSDGTFRQVFFATRDLEALGDDAPPDRLGLSGPRLVVNPIPLPPAFAPAAGLLGLLAARQAAVRHARRRATRGAA